MRFILLFCFIILMIGLPTIILWFQTNGLKNSAIFHTLIITLPLLLIGSVIVVQRTTFDMQVIQWLLWSTLLIYLPLAIYSLGLILDHLLHLSHIHSRIFGYTGIIIGSIALICLVAGVLMRNNIVVRHITVESDNLPEGFDGVRIAHITDLHLGTLSPKKKQMKRIVKTLQSENPDILCFTGDLVNQDAQEGDELGAIFAEVKAPLGRYAVMGNHDYGDYAQWETPLEKSANLLATHDLFSNLGFTLLLDSALTINRNGDTIGVIGVENCSAKMFHNYGNLNRAIHDFTPAPFNILLSHDPTHWTETVTNGNYPFVDLTLSGHTHGAQAGFKLHKFRFSPSQWVYPIYDGLYNKNGQQIYISRGIGYVGIPFRLGMNPEIAIITLQRTIK